MKILLVDNGSRYINKLKKLSRATKTINWQKLNRKLYSQYDMIILSGGHLMPVLNHDLEFKKEIALIKKINKPIIGICLGSELIAHSFGAKLKLLKHKYRGKKTITEGEDKFSVYESHRWVVKRLPSSLVSLAKSKDGVEIFKHKTRPIYGLQFHPEMLVRETSGRKIFEKIIYELI
jgi:GMP synthase (glutamine-hydrolysing)